MTLREVDRCPGKRILLVEDLSNAGLMRAVMRRNELAHIYIDEGDYDMSGFNRGSMRGLAVAVMAATIAGFDKLKAAAVDGKQAIQAFCSMSEGPSFGQRYGANPRSTGNGGLGRGNVMRSKRASKRMRNIRKHTKSAHRGSR